MPDPPHGGVRHPFAHRAERPPGQVHERGQLHGVAGLRVDGVAVGRALRESCFELISSAIFVSIVCAAMIRHAVTGSS